MRPVLKPLLLATLWVPACSGGEPPACGKTPLPSREKLVCADEWLAQATRPLDGALPGALTVKTIVDRAAGDAVYFMDTSAYPLHATFARDVLGYAPAAPFVNEYLVPQRRFLLGSVTYYQDPDVWAYELAPYDTASAEMIGKAHQRIAAMAYFGGRLKFHPTSQEQVVRAEGLPSSVPVVTTDALYRGIPYQPLNLGQTYAVVHLLSASQLPNTYVSPRELVVLDRVPNDISAVAGIITAEFQTPLSHVNVLSQQRGTPNMGLRDAVSRLSSFEGKWVHLQVGAFTWSVDEVTPEQAASWWETRDRSPTEIPAPNLAVAEILNIDDVGHADVAAVGGKAANYGELRRVGTDVRVAPAFAIPVVHYVRYMQQNGFDREVTTMLADASFHADATARRTRLADLQTRMRAAPVDAAFLTLLEAYLDAHFPDTRMKFRSSTNAEDLERHTGAGLYDSKAAKAHDPGAAIDTALRTVWASVWNFRAFEERAYAGIEHTRVAMAVLVNPSYQDEAANGVAITANIFDPAPGGEDAFYVNAQVGEASVVEPDPSVVADQAMYYHFHSGQPATYYAHSSLVPVGQTVLTRGELLDLGRSLAALREHFAAVYAPPAGYGQLPMDVEWKLVGDVVAGTRRIWIKQARPYPGRGKETH